MGKSLRFKNNVYLDSSSVVYKTKSGLYEKLVDHLHHNNFTYHGYLTGQTEYSLELDLTQFCEVSILLIQSTYSVQVIKAITYNYVIYRFIPFVNDAAGQMTICSSISRTGTGRLTFKFNTTNTVQYEIKVTHLQDFVRS